MKQKITGKLNYYVLKICRRKTRNGFWPFTLAGLAAWLLGAQSQTLHAQGGAWTNAAAMPYAAWELSAVAGTNGLLYAAGGATSDCGRTDVMYAYDPLSNTWTQMASMPASLGGFGLANLNGALYAIGGESGCGYYPAATAVSVYNCANDSWTSKNPLPTGFVPASAVVANGTLYIFGNMAGGAYSIDVYAYDSTNDTWSVATSLPGPRSSSMYAVANNIIYVMGGVDGNGFATNWVWSFNPATGLWATNSPMPTPMTSGGSSGGAAVLNGLIYLAGNFSGTNGTSLVTVLGYNPEADTWSIQPSLPTPAGASAVAALDGKLYVVGGCQEPGDFPILSTVQVFAPPSILNLSMYAGLMIQGSIGANVQIKYQNALSATNWLTLTNFALPSSPYLFIDISSPKAPQRFYQAVLGP